MNRMKIMRFFAVMGVIGLLCAFIAVGVAAQGIADDSSNSGIDDVSVEGAQESTPAQTFEEEWVPNQEPPPSDSSAAGSSELSAKDLEEESVVIEDEDNTLSDTIEKDLLRTATASEISPYVVSDYNFGNAYEILLLVNEQRVKAGVPPLLADVSLMEAAMVRAVETSIYFSHTRPDGNSYTSVLDEIAGGAAMRGTIGENIAIGYTSAQAVFDGWMSSASHKEIMLDPKYTSIGIGAISLANTNSRQSWVQLFSTASSQNNRILRENGLKTSTEIYMPADYMAGYLDTSHTRDIMLNAGESFSIVCVGNTRPETGRPTPVEQFLFDPGSLRYSSENTAVATVDEHGRILARSPGMAIITATIKDSAVSVSMTVQVGNMATAEYSVSYSSHVQSIGWQEYVNDDQVSGTTGKGRRLEALRIALAGRADSGIRYSAYVQNEGWQDFVSGAMVAGTEGRSKYMEAIRIELSGRAQSMFDVYYRVHVQRVGWLGWAKNGEIAGTTNLSLRMEAIQITLVPKGLSGPSDGAPYLSSELMVGYRSYVQGDGWQNVVYNGDMSGTQGEKKRLEGIEIFVNRAMSDASDTVSYRTHIQSMGWERTWKRNGAQSGAVQQGKRLEAIEIKLDGAFSETYDIYYRTHVQSFGWMGWAKNGESAGTAGYGYRMEGIEIRVQPKGRPAPGSSGKAFAQK